MPLSVVFWRCECGVRLKAVTATEDGQQDRTKTSAANCPKCGRERTVIANQILSVSVEETETP